MLRRISETVLCLWTKRLRMMSECKTMQVSYHKLEVLVVRLFVA
jgi:hypothetical protein